MLDSLGLAVCYSVMPSQLAGQIVGYLSNPKIGYICAVYAVNFGLMERR